MLKISQANYLARYETLQPLVCEQGIGSFVIIRRRASFCRVSIASATSLEQVAELASATRLVLPAEDIELLDRASRY